MTETFLHDALKRVVYAEDQVLLLFGESEEGIIRDRLKQLGIPEIDEMLAKA